MHANVIQSEEQLAEIVRNARTVVVLGAKDESDPGAAAFTVPRSLQDLGMKIVPVNPKLERALGEQAYPSLAEVPVRADVVDVFRRADAMPAIADEVLALPEERRPRVVWMQSGIRHDEAAEKLARAGIRVVQDHCLGAMAARFREPRA